MFSQLATAFGGRNKLLRELGKKIRKGILTTKDPFGKRALNWDILYIKGLTLPLVLYSPIPNILQKTVNQSITFYWFIVQSCLRCKQLRGSQQPCITVHLKHYELLKKPTPDGLNFQLERNIKRWQKYLRIQLNILCLTKHVSLLDDVFHLCVMSVSLELPW